MESSLELATTYRAEAWRLFDLISISHDASATTNALANVVLLYFKAAEVVTQFGRPASIAQAIPAPPTGS